MTSSENRRVSGSRKTQSHTYLFMEWSGYEQLTKDTCKVAVVLRDMTANKIVKRSGVINIGTNFGQLTIDSLEGIKDILVDVASSETPSKIKKLKSGYTLTP